jgi:mRNA-degrading endonuclease RelE of RelBE toxin-antitoxin system
VRIDLHPRLRKRVEKLTAAEREQIAASLRALADGFGNPHQHSGLGIQRLRKDLFECRAGLQWRIVFFAEKGLLTAYDVMTRDEIKAWLRSF